MDASNLSQFIKSSLVDPLGAHMTEPNTVGQVAGRQKPASVTDLPEWSVRRYLGPDDYMHIRPASLIAARRSNRQPGQYPEDVLEPHEQGGVGLADPVGCRLLLYGLKRQMIRVIVCVETGVHAGFHPADWDNANDWLTLDNLICGIAKGLTARGQSVKGVAFVFREDLYRYLDVCDDLEIDQSDDSLFTTDHASSASVAASEVVPDAEDDVKKTEPALLRSGDEVNAFWAVFVCFCQDNEARPGRKETVAHAKACGVHLTHRDVERRRKERTDFWSRSTRYGKDYVHEEFEDGLRQAWGENRKERGRSA